MDVIHIDFAKMAGLRPEPDYAAWAAKDERDYRNREVKAEAWVRAECPGGVWFCDNNAVATKISGVLCVVIPDHGQVYLYDKPHDVWPPPEYRPGPACCKKPQDGMLAVYEYVLAHLAEKALAA